MACGIPLDVQQALVSDSNPMGNITHSDLEMAGILLHVMVLESIVLLRNQHVGAICNNTPTVSWAYRLASRRSCIAGRLLRALALRLRVNRASSLLTISIAGEKMTWQTSPWGLLMEKLNGHVLIMMFLFSISIFQSTP